MRSCKLNLGGTRLPRNLKKWLAFGQCVLTILTTTLLTAMSVTVIISAHKDGNRGLAFYTSHALVNDILGWSFVG